MEPHSFNSRDGSSADIVCADYFKVTRFCKTNSLKIDVLLIFELWDQEIDSTLNSNSALSPNSWSKFVNILRTTPTISQKYLSPKFNIKVYKLQL